MKAIKWCIDGSYRSPAKRSEYEHMENVKAPVSEICPLTGDIIDEVTIPKKLVVNKFLLSSRNPPYPLGRMKRLGIAKLTEQEIDEAYDLIKEFDHDRQIC